MWIIVSLLSHLGGGWLGIESHDSDELAVLSELDIVSGVWGSFFYQIAALIDCYVTVVEAMLICLFTFWGDRILDADWSECGRCQFSQSLIHVREFPFMVRQNSYEAEVIKISCALQNSPVSAISVKCSKWWWCER